MTSQTTTIRYRSRLGTWETVPNSECTGPDQVRDASDPIDSLIASDPETWESAGLQIHTTAASHATVTVGARQYEDHDDCLAAAVDDYATEHGVESWRVTAEWVGGEDGDREEIALTVPA